MSDAAKPLPRQVREGAGDANALWRTLVLLLGRAGGGGNLTTQLMWLVLYGIDDSASIVTAQLLCVCLTT